MVELEQVPTIRNKLEDVGGTSFFSNWQGWQQTIGGEGPLYSQNGEMAVGVIDVETWTTLDSELQRSPGNPSDGSLVYRASVQVIRYSHFPFAIVVLVADMSAESRNGFLTRDMDIVLSAMGRLIQPLETLSHGIHVHGPGNVIVVQNLLEHAYLKNLVQELSAWATRIARSASYVEHPNQAVTSLLGDDILDREDGIRTAYCFDNEIISVAGCIHALRTVSPINVRVDRYSFRENLPLSRAATDPVRLGRGWSPIGFLNATVGSWVLQAASAMWLDHLDNELNGVQDEIVALEDVGPPISTSEEVHHLSDLQGRLQTLRTQAIWVGEHLEYWSHGNDGNGLLRRTQMFAVPWSPTLDTRGEIPRSEPMHEALRAQQFGRYAGNMERLQRHLEALASRADFLRSRFSVELSSSMARWSKAVGWFTFAILILTAIQVGRTLTMA